MRVIRRQGAWYDLAGRRFLDRRASDRVGLIMFGQRAYAVAPLTLDRESVRKQLRDAEVGMAGRETAIGDTIGLAVKRLRGQPAGQRVLILLTDGVNTAGLLDPLKAAELARDAQVRVHTIAFGGTGARSPFGFGMPAAEDIDEDDMELGPPSRDSDPDRTMALLKIEIYGMLLEFLVRTRWKR